MLVDASHPKPSPAAKRFEELRNDLEPTPCKPRTICLPDKLPRHVYADLVVRGRFRVIEKEKRMWASLCCSLEIEDVVSVQAGPERPKTAK